MAGNIADIIIRDHPIAQVGDSLSQTYSDMQKQQCIAIAVMQDDKPLGLLTHDDIIQLQQQSPPQTSIQAKHILPSSIAHLKLSTPIQKAFDFLFDHQRRQLLVINEIGAIEGILKLEDMMQCLAEKTTQPSMGQQADNLDPELLKKTINSIQDSIFITDADGIIQYTNQSFERIMGYSTTEVLGKTPAILNSHQQSNDFYQHLWQTLKRGQPWSGRIMNRHKDGTIFPVYMSITPILNEQGKITNFVAIHEDLSHDEALQHKIMQAQKMEAVAIMVGGVAHDFNNLLATILGNLYLMRKKMLDDEKGMSRIQVMEKAVHHGANMIQQMLTFSRQDSPDMNRMNILAFLKEVAKLVENSLPENIQFSLDYAPSSNDSYIYGNLNQLQQVILCLVNNAQDAVKDVSKPKISLTLSQEDPSPSLLLNYTGTHKKGEWQCLRCQDNGCGIAQEHIDKIFDPFFTTKTVGEGTGLGLAMVYGAVQNHHGLITAESELGNGTTLSIYIPKQQVSELQLINDHQHIHQGGGQSILLVDDDHTLRNVLDEILKESGFNTLQASNGQEAVDIFTANSNTISLIIMDVVMPIMGGVAAARQIRAINQNIPILFQTGYGEQTELDAAASIEHCDTLRKPLQVHELLMKIEEKLELSTK